MGTAVRPASTTPASWDAFSDVEVFVEEVLIELTSMAADGSRPTRSGPKPALTGAVLRKVIMAIWCVAFCGMQWQAIGQLSAIPFGTLYALFARWTRLGLWRRLLGRLRRTWRFARGVDGGKKIRGIKIQLAVEKYGLPLAIDASPANVHDTQGIVPVLRQLAEQGFQGPAIGDLGYRGKRLAKAGDGLGITSQPIARGRNGVFIPTEIAWVVERSFSWLSRYRRLNTIVERTKEHLVAFVEIAFISILSRHLQRLAPKQVSA